MNPQPDIALGQPGILRRLTALSELVQPTQSVRLASAAVIGHLVTFVSLPVILRIYGPEAFGEYSLILSIGYVLLILATLKLEAVIPTMRHVSLAARLTSGLFLLSLLVCLAVFPLGLAVHWLTGWTPGHAIPALPVFAITAGLVLLFGVFLVMRNWLVRLNALKGAAVMHLMRPVGFVLVAIVFGYMWPDAAPANGLMLLVATALALLAAILLGYTYVPLRLRPFLWPTRWRRSWQEMRANTEFLSAVSFSQTLDLISRQIPLWATTALYGAVPAGWVALAGRLVFLPVMVAGASLAPIVNRHVSTAYHSKKVLAAQLSTYLFVLSLVGAVGFGLIAMSGSWLVDVVFGDLWAGSAQTLKIYCLYGFAYFLNVTIGFVPILMRERFYLVLINLLRFLGLCGMCLVAYAQSVSFETFVFGLVGVETCAYLTGVGYAIYLVRRHDGEVLRAPNPSKQMLAESKGLSNVG
ncbi:MAG: oligosaccharide flippase family protein [Pseudomonadota bacterium]